MLNNINCSKYYINVQCLLYYQFCRGLIIFLIVRALFWNYGQRISCIVVSAVYISDNVLHAYHSNQESTNHFNRNKFIQNSVQRGSTLALLAQQSVLLIHLTTLPMGFANPVQTSQWPSLLAFSFSFSQSAGF